VLALFWLHPSNIMEDYGIFCNIYLTKVQNLSKVMPVMVGTASLPHRAVVEHLVRQAVYQRLGKTLPKAATAPTAGSKC